LFSYLSIAIDGEKAAEKEIAIRFGISDEKSSYCLVLKNGVLHHRPSDGREQVQLALSIPKSKLVDFVAESHRVKEIFAPSDVTAGSLQTLEVFAQLIATFSFDWNIVTR
jgi:alkyl sulfatase BDS1-like metallo-beta-lactamase superfamily hydrolase